MLLARLSDDSGGKVSFPSVGPPTAHPAGPLSEMPVYQSRYASTTGLAVHYRLYDHTGSDILVRGFRETEIENLDAAFAGDQNVVGLQIAVDDTRGMRGRQPAALRAQLRLRAAVRARQAVPLAWVGELDSRQLAE